MLIKCRILTSIDLNMLYITGTSISENIDFYPPLCLLVFHVLLETQPTFEGNHRFVHCQLMHIELAFEPRKKQTQEKPNLVESTVPRLAVWYLSITIFEVEESKYPFKSIL